MRGRPWQWDISNYPLFVFLSCSGDQIFLEQSRMEDSDCLGYSSDVPEIESRLGGCGLTYRAGIFLSERDCLVWSLFSLYHKNEWLFLPLSLNKGGPFGFHNSDHLSPSWNGHVGSRAQRLPPSPQRGPVPGLGAVPAPFPIAAFASASVLCCLWGHNPLRGQWSSALCSLGGHFTSLLPGMAWNRKE